MPAKELSTLIRLSRANYSLNFPCFANAVTKVWYTFVECRQWRGCKNPFLCPAFLFPWFCQGKTQVQSKKALLGFLHSRNVELLRQRNSLPRECLATICKTPSLTVGRRKQLVTVLQYGRLGSGCVALLNPVGVSFRGAIADLSETACYPSETFSMPSNFDFAVGEWYFSCESTLFSNLSLIRRLLV